MAPARRLVSQIGALVIRMCRRLVLGDVNSLARPTGQRRFDDDALWRDRPGVRARPQNVIHFAIRRSDATSSSSSKDRVFERAPNNE